MKYNQFSNIVSEILAFSREEADRLNADKVSPEHLLLAMLRIRRGTTKQLFDNMNMDRNELKVQLQERLKPADGFDTIKKSTNMQEIILDEKASNILRLAVLESRLQHKDKVDDIHLLLAMLRDNTNTMAKQVLEQNGINYDNTSKALSGVTGATDSFDYPEDDENDEFEDVKHSNSNMQATKEAKTKSKTPALDNFGNDLTRAAAEGLLDPVVGREKEIYRVIEILGRRKKNNPILIGDPGVGKSAIVEGLAQMIASKRVAPSLANKRVVNLDLSLVVAGTKYRGQFEERIKMIIRELEQNPDIIVFIDEIHTMVGAGSAPGSMDAANMLKPALARGQVQCIGATTIDEYRKSIEKDGALERRFQKVMVEPTTADETIEILQNLKDRYEQHHHVIFDNDAIKACVNLTGRYINDRMFPDKAIDALDETGSKVRLANQTLPPELVRLEEELKEVIKLKDAAVQSQDYEKAAQYRDRQVRLQEEINAANESWLKDSDSVRHVVTAGDVAEVVSVMSGVPVSRIASSEGIRLKGMAESLKGEVIAQDEAINKVVKAIQRNRVGLRTSNHPIGVFMFLGPTGVGKTYLTKKLAEYMFGSDKALIRLDMSEYHDKYTASRLIGSAPGYVGYEEGGQLTEKVRRKPYSIILLDEIEKADPGIYNLLLQVLDEGRLTDSQGRNVDFKNTVIIMTSNAGTRRLKEFQHGVGFNAAGKSGVVLDEKDREYARSIIQKSLSKQFAPEFLNRIDEIITFEQLDEPALNKICAIELGKLSKRLQQLGYNMSITEEAQRYVASKGYDVQFGARPLTRAIQTYIEDALGEMIVNEEISEGDTIIIDCHTDDNGEKRIDISKQ